VDDRARRPILGWAGPWPLDEFDWDPARHRLACRFQVVDQAQGAWLLLLDDQSRWWVEARYD
jgi:protein ImuB